MKNKNKALTPSKLVEVNGNLYYDDKIGAWSILRLKAELVHTFRQLKEKTSKFNYKILFYRDYEGFEKEMKKIVKEKDVLPILMFFEKVDN